jgi:hypothetical protein
VIEGAPCEGTFVVEGEGNLDVVPSITMEYGAAHNPIVSSQAECSGIFWKRSATLYSLGHEWDDDLVGIKQDIVGDSHLTAGP